MKKKKIKFKFILMVFLAIMGLSLQSCGDGEEPKEPEIKVYEAPSFKAINKSVDGDKELCATDSKVIVNLNYNVTIIVNGEPQTFTGTCHSNELPVLPGNEISITASFDEDSATGYVCFVMPNGDKMIVSKTSPDCTWTVPRDFVTNTKITAQWADKDGKIQHPTLSSSITLITLE